MELGELWDRLSSSTELWAALLGALVGGIASGLASLGGSVLVEKMKLRPLHDRHVYGAATTGKRSSDLV